MILRNTLRFKFCLLYGGKAEVYMDVGEAMGKAMVGLLKGGK